MPTIRSSASAPAISSTFAGIIAAAVFLFILAGVVWYHSQYDGGHVESVRDHPAYVALRAEHDRLAVAVNAVVARAANYMDASAYRQFTADTNQFVVAAAADSERGDVVTPVVSCPPVETATVTCSCPTAPTCPPVPPTAAAPVCPTCAVCPALSSSSYQHQHAVNLLSEMSSDDRSAMAVDLSADEFTHEWRRCEGRSVRVPWLGNVEVCDEADYRSEQWYEKSQFILPNDVTEKVVKPRAPRCIQLPPPQYRFPDKYAPVPAPENSSAVHWPNHRVYSIANLSMFNEGYSKNLYHFDAAMYDREQEVKINVAAKYIPFKQRVRNGLDIGAGGGSLGVIMKRRYDVTVLSLAYAEYPYCEYMSERGTLCAYINAFWSMPFPKFAFDFVHAAWLFHMYSQGPLVDKLMELNRIIRPGGYLWWEGGFSLQQRDTVIEWASALGYALIYDDQVQKETATKFGALPHQLDWTAIFIKPTKQATRECTETNKNNISPPPSPPLPVPTPADAVSSPQS